MPIDEDFCRVSAYLRHTIQTVVMKPGENDRLVWDGTTTLLALDIVMNQVTPVNCKAPITFGHIKIQLYIDIYNTSISHPYCYHPFGYGQHQGMFSFPHNPSQLVDGCFWIHGRWFLQPGHGDGIWIYYLRV